MATVSRLVWTCAAVCLGVAACGARTGLLIPTEDTVQYGPDGSCLGVAVPLQPNVPNLYFVLDVSTSMAEMNKWPNVRTAVGALITQLGPSARFGAAVFPAQGPGGGNCAPGVEIMSLRLGDTQGATESTFLQATSFPPNGGTPTAPTLDKLAPELASFQGPTYVILATDGGPNCNAEVSCTVSTCTTNIDGAPGCSLTGPSCCPSMGAGGGSLGCLDGDRTVQAVAKLDAMGIQTFVLGIPGSAPYASLLDSVAIAGGTARSTEPLYYRVDATDTTSLGDVFAEIAAKTMASCVFQLTAQPSDPSQVNVMLGDAIVHQQGANGWTLSGTQLTLEGSSCLAIQQTPAPALSVTQGCPTIP